MPTIKRTILIMLSCLMCVSGSIIAHAQTNSEALKSVQQKLEQGAQEKQSVNKDIANVQQEMQSISTYIASNKDQMAKTEQKIADTNQLIEKEKEQIVTLEDKILARKDVMKKRLVALQHDDNVSLIIKVFLEAKSFDDLIQKASAVSALFTADKDILGAQENDLAQVQKDKKEIDSQEQKLVDDQKALAKQQEELSQNLQKRQEALSALQQKVSQINKQMADAKAQKSTIETQIKAAQEALLREQQAAKAGAAQAMAQTVQPGAGLKGQELYVTATAYTPYDSGSVTKLGYNIQKNPNMKLIAVDPSVIPLGSRVWVEGYGEAIAGDTGGAIVGNRIDVLVPTKAQAQQWGRRTVKVIILN